MLHIEFQASEPIGSEEEIFLIFYMYFYGLNQGPPMRFYDLNQGPTGVRPSWILRPSFGQTW